MNQFLQQFGAGQPARSTRPQVPAQPERPRRPEPTELESLTRKEQFERHAKKILFDGQIDEKRRRHLETRAAEIGLKREETLKIVEKTLEDRKKLVEYFLTQIKALAPKGRLDPDDRRFLDVRGKDMGLDPWETDDLIELTLERSRKHDLYRSILEAFFEDGILDDTEEKTLELKREDLGLRKEEHDDVLKAVQKERGAFAKDVLGDIRKKDSALGALEEDLDLYGRKLFKSSPEAYTPAIGLPPPDSYVIGPGDRLQIALWGRLEAEYQLAVDGEGRVQIPKVGTIRVGGLTYGDAKELLKGRAESITGVSAAVAMSETRSVLVFVVGEVEKPGSVTLTPLSTVIHALMAAGGPTKIGSLRNVILRRSGGVAATLDLYAFLRKGETKGDRPLENGDVVVVPKGDRLVRLFGKVKRPAVYELKGNEGILALLDYAGGLAADAYGGRIQVERAQGHDQRIVLDAPLPKAGQDSPLQDGDTVRVFPLKPEIANQVGLFGHVHQPGKRAFIGQMRVTDLIGSLEDLRPDADLSYAVILRETGSDRAKTVVPVDLGKAFGGKGQAEDAALQPQDEVYVFARQQFWPPLSAKATGEVRIPGLYRIEKGARVADLVRLAGGVGANALLGRAEVVRYLPDRTRRTVYVDLRKALEGDPRENLELSDEDELAVHPVSDEQAKPVVLIEGEIAGAEDKRLPRARSVQEKFKEILEREKKQDQARREAREKEKDKGKEKQGEGKPENRPVPDPTRPESQSEADQRRLEPPKALEVALTRGMTVSGLVFKTGGLTKDAYLPLAHLYRTEPATKVITIHTFHLGRAMEGDPDEDLVLQDLDHVVVHSAFDFVPIRKVTIAGTVNRPGDYPYAANMRVLDLVLAAGGLAEEAYLGEAEVVRTEVPDGENAATRTLSFPLGAAMKGAPEGNLALKPYDKVFIKKIPEWKKSRVVELAGEFRFPGSYYIAKGEKLSQLLKRAGGYADEAYLRGAVFTRESVRIKQQERLDELRERLSQAILRTSSAEVRSALSAEDVAAQRQFLASQEELVKKLELTRATGRVVVRLLPLKELENSEWDIALEDGDTLNVPKTPQTVAVVGQVYNPTAFLWEPDHREVEHYLRKTGGPTPDADEKEIYVVRADGTVVSSRGAEAGSWWSKGMMDLKMFPGDTVLVPEKIIKVSYMKEFKDLTQILYQIAVTAGVAIAVL